MKLCFAPFGIGSLPFFDWDTACRFVAEHYVECPFLPQLPRLSQWHQMLYEPFRGLERFFLVQEKGVSPIITKGELSSFLEACSQDFETSEAENALGKILSLRSNSICSCKFQTVGPITLLKHLQYAGKPLAKEKEAIEIVWERLVQNIIRLVSPFKAQLGELLVVIDEPVLPYIRRVEIEQGSLLRQVLIRTITRFRASGFQVGLHCCAPIPGGFFRELLLEATLDLLSLPWQDPETPLGNNFDEELLVAYTRPGRTFVAGLIAPERENRVKLIGAQFFENLKRLGLLDENSCSGIGLSASCGFGLVRADTIGARQRELVELGNVLRELTLLHN